MEISNYDRWKFRRCTETLDRYDERCRNCDKCDFNIGLDKWNILLLETVDK